MALTKETKKGIIEDLKKIVKESATVVFVNFHGLNVFDTTTIRKMFKTKKVGFTIAKKTLTRKALEGEKVEGSQPSFDGELGLVYSGDLLDPAREVYTFQKKFENRIAILGGIFEKKYMNKDEMVAIAQIPPLKTLHAQFVNIINSPIQGLVMALSEIAKKKTV